MTETDGRTNGTDNVDLPRYLIIPQGLEGPFPKATYESMWSRLKRFKQWSEECAEYCRERAAIEDHYAKQLIKLHKKHTSATADHSLLGDWATIWDEVTQEIAEQGALHALLGQTLLENIEKSLKSVCDTADVQKFKSHENAISKLIRDYDDKRDRVLKVQKKQEADQSDASKKKGKDKTEKREQQMAIALSQLDESITKWKQEMSPQAELLESIDKQRLEQLVSLMNGIATTLESATKAHQEQLDKLKNSVQNFNVENEILRFSKYLQGQESSKARSRTQSVESGLSVVGASRRLTQRFNQMMDGRKSVGGASQLSDRPTAAAVADAIENASTEATDAPQVDEEGYTIRPDNQNNGSANWASQYATKAKAESDSDEDDDNVPTAPKIVIDIKKDAIDVAQPEDLVKVMSTFSPLTVSVASSKRRGRKPTIDSVTSQQSDATSVGIPALGNTKPSNVNFQSPLAVPATIDFFATSPTVEALPQRPLTATSVTSASSSAAASAIVTLPKPVTEKSFSVASLADSLNAVNDSDSSISKLVATITETIHAIYSGNQLLKLQILGEISLVYSGPRGIVGAVPADSQIHLRLTQADRIQKALANPVYASALQPDSDVPSASTLLYACRAQRLLASAATGTPITLLRYQVAAVSNPSAEAYLPLCVQPSWRLEGKQTLMLIQVETRTASAFKTMTDNSPNMIQGVSLAVHLESPSNISSALAKPPGVWQSEAKRYLWSLGNWGASVANSQKLMAKFEVDGDTAATPTPVAAQFRMQHVSLSHVSVDIIHANEEDKFQIPQLELQYWVQAGKYMAERV